MRHPLSILWFSAWFGIGGLFFSHLISFWFSLFLAFLFIEGRRLLFLGGILWAIYFLFRLELTQQQALRLNWIEPQKLEFCFEKPTQFGSQVRIKEAKTSSLIGRSFYLSLPYRKKECSEGFYRFRVPESYQSLYFPGLELKRELQGAVGSLKNVNRKERGPLRANAKTDEFETFKAAALYGKADLIEQELWQAGRRLGVAHLFVISGSHISFIFLVLSFAFLSCGRLHPNLAVSLSSICVFSYLYFCELDLPAWRAGILFFVLSLLPIFFPSFRRYSGIQVLSLVGLVFLLIQPLWLPSPTYILSFGVCCFISLCSENFLKSFAASLGGFFLSSFLYFSNSIFFVAANIIYGASFCFIVFPSLWLTELFPALDSFVRDLVYIFTSSLKFFSELSYSFPSFHLSIEQAFILGAALLLLMKKKASVRVSMAGIILLSLLAGFMPTFRFFETDSVELLDVGQGDALILRLDGKIILIDGGKRPKLLSELRSRDIRKIDLWILSHFDSDHIENFVRDSREFSIKEIWIPRWDRSAFSQWLSQYYAGRVRTAASDKLNLNFSQYRLHAHCPYLGNLDQTVKNPHSLVLEVWKSGQLVGLSMGDLPAAQEKIWLKSWNLEPSRPIFVKVGHHGSKTSSSNAFIKFFQPQFALFPVGRRNYYQFPHPSVLDRFEREGATIKRTDTLGSIKIDF